MKTLFDWITRAALRFRAITLSVVVLVMILGVTAATQLQQELLPPVEFPQTIVFAQVSGMESEEVLEVVTKRIEAELATIEAIVNIESTTNNTIGALIVVSNDFGLDQTALREEIQIALDNVWLPQREIAPPVGTSSEDFAQTLFDAVTPDMMLYLARNNPNFVFQLLPATWERLPDDAVDALLAYLATEFADTGASKNALTRLVEQEVVPQLRAIETIANVRVDGGQTLPGEGDNEAPPTEVTEPRPRLYQLSNEVWRTLTNRYPEIDEINEDAVAFFATKLLPMPQTPPELPEVWRAPHFYDMTDIVEIISATRNTADIINQLARTGSVKGALGMTSDLTPEVVTRMLDLAPTLVNYFTAEQLASLSDEVFAVLPEDFIDQLDGFTRDELAAVTLAQTITGEEIQRPPVRLPSAWRIAPPRIITFSFADIPLATFSVFGEAPVEALTTMASPTVELSTDEDTTSPTQTISRDLPPAPDLPQLYTIIGELFGAELITTADLVDIQPSGEFAQAFAGASLTGADFFNLLLQFDTFTPPLASDGEGGAGFADFDLTSFLPALVECGFGLLDIDPQNPDIARIVIGCLPVDSFQYLVDNDPAFLPQLQAEVYPYLQSQILELDGVSPPLGSAWSTLANQPQFSTTPLRNADDIIALGQGSPSQFLNLLNDAIPPRFAGYEIRLFDSLTPLMVDYFTRAEPDFIARLDDEVLLDFAPVTLASLPAQALEGRNVEVIERLVAIAQGETPSAVERLQALYTVDTIPTDPDAPLLGATWQTIVPFVPGVDTLENASDLLRFPNAIGNPAMFINSFLRGAGASLAPDLIGELTIEAIEYILVREANFLRELEPAALLLLSEETFDWLPSAIQERAQTTDAFIPATQITRTNGASSLLVTVFKDADANTVEAFYQVAEVIDRINAENENIEIFVAFEQSSFVETSITGVIREGTLGAFFAIVNILIFLSGGYWNVGKRRIVGIITFIVFAAHFSAVIGINLPATDGDIVKAFHQADTVLRIIGLLGMLSGIFILLYPSSLPYPAWRSTLVIAVSIPLSILSALALMRWFPLTDGLTLNIMTLSGLTVAVGRVVDDSIVVLENIFRQMQTGIEKREAILSGVRDVSVAIFSATSIAVVVFLPLGLTGGLIGEFFLPFGLAVTYALLSSFFIAITVIPTLAYIFISIDDVPPETETWIQKLYVPSLKIALYNNAMRWLVIVLAVLSAIFGAFLFSTRPAAFLPDFGEPRITVSVNLPQDFNIIQTNELVIQMEASIVEIMGAENIATVSTTVGGGGLGFSALFGGGGVDENRANIQVGLISQDLLDVYTLPLRARAQEIFGEDNVTVSATTIASGGFGGFELVVSASDQAILEQYDAQIIAALNSVEGLTNVTSNLTEAIESGSITFIRSNQSPAASYTAELETQDTIGITGVAIEAIVTQVDLPDGVRVSQGFDSEVQTEGFQSVFVAMAIAVVIVVTILVLVFGSPIYWLAVIFSIVVAPVGAAVALTLTDRVLGISALIGLLMLLGLVVTNAVVLIDRVGSNRFERGMPLYDALIEAGSRRVRPILMTALATIIALIPLAIGLSEGAIIASELGTVVIGGILSSTFLTLMAVPAAYYIFTPVHDAFANFFKSRKNR